MKQKRMRITKRLPMPKPARRHGDKRKAESKQACRAVVKEYLRGEREA